MTDARSLLESLTLPIADRLEQVMPPITDEGLVQWATLHGWDSPIDRQVVACQAALNLVLRALICYRLSATELPTAAPAHFILAHSNSLLQNLGITPQPSSYLDHPVVQVEVALQKSRIAALASALQREQRDVIGDAYASWVPQNARRTLGQFWTPWPIAQLMTQWAIQSPDDYVLDPAFGSGILLLTSIDRLAHLGVPIASVSRQAAGVELSPLVFLMGLTNLLLRHVPHAQIRLQWG